VPDPTAFRSRILAGDLLVGTFLGLGAPVAVEAAGRSGLDWVLLDLEHGGGTEADLLAQLYAAQLTGVPTLVRVESNARLRFGRALDLGAGGIMVPRLETADEARDAVSYLRWPPSGVRGVALGARGSMSAGIGHGDVAGFADRLALAVQIENPQIVDAADEVAAIDGVDVLFVGPTDLSHSLGIPGQFDHPRQIEAYERVIAACRRAGKSPGILLRSVSLLDRHLELGFRFIGVGADLNFIIDGAAAVVAAARAARGGSIPA
jgi:2-keto-3-deoxy-L-rhamnonate aldolase RhmA